MEAVHPRGHRDGGVAIFDFDNDGLEDVFVAVASTLDAPGDDATTTSRLDRNLGQLRFADVTAKARLDRGGWAQGVCVGDYDNDSHRDLFVTRYGRSLLYRNVGDGTFRDITEAAGLALPGVRWETGCTFVDYDLDGKLDIAVTSYLESTAQRSQSLEAAATASGRECRSCAALRTAFRATGCSGISAAGSLPTSRIERLRPSRKYYAFTVVGTDVTGDGYPDLYIACDSTPSLLYVNRGDGTFEEEGLLAGVALNADGQEQGGMASRSPITTATAGWTSGRPISATTCRISTATMAMDRSMTGCSSQGSARTCSSRLGHSFPGCGSRWSPRSADGERPCLPGSRASSRESIPPAPATVSECRRPVQGHLRPGRCRHSGRLVLPGSAAGDLDNDGSLEVVVSNLGNRPSLLKNVGPRKNWLLLDCEGVRANRDAIGALVSVEVNGRRMSAEIQGASSFISQNDSRLHFGLGDRPRYDGIEVRWPGGGRERFGGGAANEIRVLKQGTGTAQ